MKLEYAFFCDETAIDPDGRLAALGIGVDSVDVAESEIPYFQDVQILLGLVALPEQDDVTTMVIKTTITNPSGLVAETSILISREIRPMLKRLSIERAHRVQDMEFLVSEEGQYLITLDDHQGTIVKLPFMVTAFADF